MKLERSLNQFNNQIIQCSFLRAAEAGVRLGHFGATVNRLNTDKGHFFENLSDIQAHDDLIALAISGRRLADVGGYANQARKQKVSLVAPIQLSPSKWKIKSLENSVTVHFIVCFFD